ncbi:hypothetical protein SAMN06265795_11456 [Noviherbaspirillum humi]|uniref:Uncharacterized protein n=1 Tax=Noviherbaspirillum humi TaxID=1688639 RepID=A0A239JZJ0_9BURK|nr:hypothetical protein SAMN06265795_11456 [Noviherbaspirillum humi]
MENLVILLLLIIAAALVAGFAIARVLRWMRMDD